MTVSVAPQSDRFQTLVSELYGTRPHMMAQVAQAVAGNGESTTPPDVRTLYRQAVDEVAAKAREALPQSNGRIEAAVKLVLAGDVELLPEGKARVASQSNGETKYFVVNGECSCKDFAKAPQSMCKHRIAYGIAKRAKTRTTEKLDAATLNSNQGGAQMLPPAILSASENEAPAENSTDISTNSPSPETGTHVGTGFPPSIPAQFLVTIQGRQFVTYNGLLAMATERGLVSLSAHFLTVTSELATAEATAEFRDGRTFMECGDATPQNVNPRVKPHFCRMALTRAKARALRDALNISMVSIEELE